MEELKEALRKTKNGETPGHDKILAKMLKKMGNEGTKLLLNIVNKAWAEETII